MEEKRKTTRADCHFDVKMILENRKEVMSLTKNLSLKGALLETSDELKLHLGDHITCQIVLTGKDNLNDISAKAQVVRIDLGRGVGVKFVEMNPEELGKLRKLMSFQVGDADQITDDLKGIIEDTDEH